MHGGGDGDLVLGDGGDDKLFGDGGRDLVEGATGADTLQGGEGPDELAGGAGRDTAVYAGAAHVRVTLDDQDDDGAIDDELHASERDRVVVENVVGGGQIDTFTGSAEANALNGAAGEDYVDGEAGADALAGGAEADVIAARDGAADQEVTCGPGEDFAIVDALDRSALKRSDDCEVVDNGSRRTPVAGRKVFAQPQTCGGMAMQFPGMVRDVPLDYAVRLPIAARTNKSTRFFATDECGVDLTAAAGRGATTKVTVTGDNFRILQRGAPRPPTTVELEDCPATAPGDAVAAGHTRSPPFIYETRVRPGKRGRRARRASSAGASRRLARPVRVASSQSKASASAAATWETVENCDSTTTTVSAGTITVRDRATGERVTLRKGDSYTAGERPAG